MFSYPLIQKLPHFISLTRLNRPIGIYLLLWPTLWALWFAAKGKPSTDVFIIFVLGTILTRAAGCAINDFADRHIDGKVARTQTRPLATGALSPKEALIAAALLMLIAFALVLLTNTLTILMSFVALALASLYPFTKRFTHWPQAFLGAAYAFAIPMAFAAQLNTVPSIAWAIYGAAFIWAVAYDTLYAMADREFDLKIGVKSTAILFGRYDLLIVGCLQAAVLLIMCAVGWHMQRGFWFFTGVLLAAGFAVYQLYIARHRNPNRCLQAFLNNHYLGLMVFLGIVIDYAVNTGSN